MGLIKAISGAIGSTMADQWVEYIKCDAMPANILAMRGRKETTRRSSNTKGEDNVITDGSRVDVADGQCMLIVENGRVLDFCAEPGQYVYQTGTQPSLFSGGLGNLSATFEEVGRRFSAGGQALSTQRVYYINTKEIYGNKWGVGNVPFRDSEFNFSIKLRAYGEYSYRISDPLLFYVNVCGNMEAAFDRSRIESQLRAEMQSAMQPALGRMALQKVPHDMLPNFTEQICAELNTELTEKWGKKRGISMVSMAIAGVNPDEESLDMIQKFQESRVYTDPRMMGARLGGAQANAMEYAAQNQAGAMTGFMGMGFAQQAGGGNAAQFYQMGQQPAAPAPAAAPAQTPAAAPAAPAQPEQGWSCPGCGTVNQGKFCHECGAKKPAGAPLYRCDKCGWQPEDPQHPPKFCPECGDRFDDNDVQG